MKRYLCHHCGQEFTVDTIVMMHDSGVNFCPFCGSQNVMMCRQTVLAIDSAACFTQLKAPRELLRLLYTFWSERPALRTKYPTCVAYIRAIIAGEEALPTDG